MKKILFLFTLSLILVRCIGDEEPIESECTCSTPATVRDLTGLDGCGFVFELEDGTRIEPMVVFECGTGLPGGEQTTIARPFEWTDGAKVRIDYELRTDLGSYCMVGQIAKITCMCSTSESPTQQEP
jgi:hypothetical protein